MFFGRFVHMNFLQTRDFPWMQGLPWDYPTPFTQSSRQASSWAFFTKRSSAKENAEFQDLSHDMTRPTKWVCIRPVWSESSLSAWRNLGSLATHWGHSEDSDQTGWMPRLIWVFARRIVTLSVLSCCGSFTYVLFLPIWNSWYLLRASQTTHLQSHNTPRLSSTHMPELSSKHPNSARLWKHFRLLGITELL